MDSLRLTHGTIIGNFSVDNSSVNDTIIDDAIIDGTTINGAAIKGATRGTSTEEGRRHQSAVRMRKDGDELVDGVPASRRTGPVIDAVGRMLLHGRFDDPLRVRDPRPRLEGELAADPARTRHLRRD